MADSAACLVCCAPESAAKKKQRKIQRSNALGGSTRFGVYEIDCHADGSLCELGRGAMGVTYRATDTSLQRKVALKIIKTDIAERSADARERFMREARAAAALRNENIATIYQFGMRLETGQYFYAMELIEGETLDERVRRTGPLSVRSVIDIAQQVTAALATVEKRGLVHRDLKPANLMLISPDGETTGAGRNNEKVFVKIIDFGLAKALNAPVDPNSLTHERFVGTPAFASPEQFEHSALDVRSDIYSLGETLWFALTGKTPFAGRSVQEIHQAQQSNALPMEQLKAAHVPSGLRSLLQSMLALEPAARPGTHDLAAQLQRCAAQTSEKIRSIAVLPFADLSAERDQEHFSNGVAEEILNALSKVRGLDVPARTSCFAFRGTTLDAREIGKHLGVETLLDGSIRKAGKRVRISVQLVDASNGYQLWSERFDREIEDIFAIQDEIARSVLESLGLALSEREEFRFLKPSTTNIDAYEAYLRGRKLYHKWTSQSVEFARQMFERAVKIDPDFAAAWAGLANCHVDLFRWGRNPRDLEEAHRASERALKLDPNSAEAHVSVGQALAIKRRYAEAAIAFDRAIEKDPTLFQAYYLYGRVLFESGDVEKSAKLFEKAQRVRPDDYQARCLNAAVLTELGRQDEAHRAHELAVKSIEKHLELNPDEARAYSMGGSALIRLGETERSKQWTEQAMKLAPKDPLILYNAACNWALLGEHQRALDGLERALEAGVAVGDWLWHDPDFESLRNHPRFQTIVKRIAPS